jgi:hypothetical protein
LEKKKELVILVYHRNINYFYVKITTPKPENSPINFQLGWHVRAGEESAEEKQGLNTEPAYIASISRTFTLLARFIENLSLNFQLSCFSYFII